MGKNMIPYQLGRKNQTEYQARQPDSTEDPLIQIRAMASIAVEQMEAILEDETIPDRAKMQVIDMILDRTYGSPETTMKIRNAMDAEEQSMARMERIIGGLSGRPPDPLRPPAYKVL